MRDQTKLKPLGMTTSNFRSSIAPRTAARRIALS